MFIPNKIYKRSEIHNKYGLNRQSGICSKKDKNYIFIFSGSRGKKFGYKDHWDFENNDIFYYTGQGSSGDMEFTKGNKEIKNHKENNKKIYLFENQKSSFVKFISEMEYISHEIRDKDSNGIQRKIIIFKLKKSNNSKFYKKIDFSIFNEGTAIPLSLQKNIDLFLNKKLEKGDKISVSIRFLDRIYEAKIVIPNNKSKKLQYQLKYKDKLITQSLQTIFNNSYNYIMNEKLNLSTPEIIKSIYDDFLEITFNKDNKIVIFEPIIDKDIEVIKDTYEKITHLKNIKEKDKYLTKIDKDLGELVYKSPEKIKKIIHVYERGNISYKVKKESNFKCQICEALGKNPIGFIKKNSTEPYIEAHHVIPVSSKTKGSLHPRNLICVCPNHHRQIHYGNVETLPSKNDKYFKFKIDNKTISIKRLLNWKI